MYQPHVRFRLNKALDKKMMLEFLGLRAGGINFANGIFGPHPDIKKSINQYIDRFYSKHKTLLHKQALNFKEKWKRGEESFFQIVSFVFNNHPWPKGKYIGYISIFNCNPRFLEDKTFQIFFRHELGPVHITAHELLHFIFYDFFAKNYPRYENPAKIPFVWHISEIFNSVIQSSPLWIKVFETKPLLYPEHRRAVRILSKWWIRQPKQNARLLINQIIATYRHSRSNENY